MPACMRLPPQGYSGAIMEADAPKYWKHAAGVHHSRNARVDDLGKTVSPCPDGAKARAHGCVRHVKTQCHSRVGSPARFHDGAAPFINPSAHFFCLTLIGQKEAAPSPTPPDSGQFAPLVGAFLFLEAVCTQTPKFSAPWLMGA